MPRLLPRNVPVIIILEYSNFLTIHTLFIKDEPEKGEAARFTFLMDALEKIYLGVGDQRQIRLINKLKRELDPQWDLIPGGWVWQVLEV